MPGMKNLVGCCCGAPFCEACTHLPTLDTLDFNCNFRALITPYVDPAGYSPAMTRRLVDYTFIEGYSSGTPPSPIYRTLEAGRYWLTDCFLRRYTSFDGYGTFTITQWYRAALTCYPPTGGRTTPSLAVWFIHYDSEEDCEALAGGVVTHGGELGDGPAIGPAGTAWTYTCDPFFLDFAGNPLNQVGWIFTISEP